MGRSPSDNPYPSTLTPEEESKLDGVKKRLEELTRLTNIKVGFGPGIPNTRDDRLAKEEDAHNERWLEAISSLPDARPLLRLAPEFRRIIEEALDQVGLMVDTRTHQVTPK